MLNEERVRDKGLQDKDKLLTEINLLKHSQPSFFQRFSPVAVLNRFLVAVLLGLVVFWAWLFFQGRNAKGTINRLEDQTTKQQQELSQNQWRDEVVTRQAQIKALDDLITNHLYWSQLLSELAKVTLKSASYLSFQAESENNEINLAVSLPSMADLDKFLQAFDSTQLNRYFSDLKLGGVGKVASKGQNFIRVDIQLKFNPELLKYQADKQ